MTRPRHTEITPVRVEWATWLVIRKFLERAERDMGDVEKVREWVSKAAALMDSQDKDNAFREQWIPITEAKQ